MQHLFKTNLQRWQKSFSTTDKQRRNTSRSSLQTGPDSLLSRQLSGRQPRFVLSRIAGREKCGLTASWPRKIVGYAAEKIAAETLKYQVLQNFQHPPNYSPSQRCFVYLCLCIKRTNWHSGTALTAKRKPGCNAFPFIFHDRFISYLECFFTWHVSTKDVCWMYVSGLKDLPVLFERARDEASAHQIRTRSVSSMIIFTT